MTQIVDSRSSVDSEAAFKKMVPEPICSKLEAFPFRYRRRKCLKCGATFKTVELRYDDVAYMMRGRIDWG